MHLIVPTVPHTGTLFVTHLFIDLGYDHRSLQDSREEWESKCVFTGHIVKPERVGDAVAAMEKYHAIVPIRHPYLVAESWKRRGKELDNLLTSFYHLAQFIDPLKPYYLPMDVPERGDYLDQIIKGLNLPIKTKWPVINSKHGTSELTWKDVTPDPEIVEITELMSPFFKRFY